MRKVFWTLLLTGVFLLLLSALVVTPESDAPAIHAELPADLCCCPLFPCATPMAVSLPLFVMKTAFISFSVPRWPAADAAASFILRSQKINIKRKDG